MDVNKARCSLAQATDPADDGPSSLESPRSDGDRSRDIAKIRTRLATAKYRCDHPAGKNAVYQEIAFDFASPAEGARLLYQKLGALPAGGSLDRIDPTGPYSLENLRYAGPTLQSVNRRVVLNGWRSRHASPK